ncbi:hypothetical protein [Pseudovibrio ascidiaceicola]|uniref:hypothetical protein n=1 Tax=Pseudovibrio ascidiaceicola TaxID=285279 RepID=UPI000D6870B5|nr:hypothetical protein [Pseudovibrio ascidiaceicola]
MKTPAGAARGMARPAPLPKRSCLNEDAQTGEHKGSAVRFTHALGAVQAKRINRPHAGPSWTRAVIFSAMCTRSGIGNPLRIDDVVEGNGNGGGWEGDVFKAVHYESQCMGSSTSY